MTTPAAPGQALSVDDLRRRILAGPATPVVALLLAMVSIQYGAAFAKGLFPAVGAEGTVALRVGFGALILVGVFRPWRTPLARGSVGSLIGYGAALGAMNLMFYMSLRTTPLGIAVALEFSGPLAVAVISSRRASHFGWIALAVLGLAMILPLDRARPALDPRGAALALAAGGCWALYIVFGQRAGGAHGARAPALGAVVAALLVTPIGAAHAGAALLAPGVLGRGVVLAVLSSALPYSLEMIALRRMPARVFGTLMSLEPAVGALMGFMVLDEAPTALQAAAIALIIAASAGAASTARDPVAEAAAALPD